jgi:uncharacterized protein YndB with AHSA1/START domain
MKVEIEREFKASKEQLYRFWTDPNTISEWFGVKVSIEPKLGGFLKIDFGEKELTSGVYKKLDPFNTVAFTWNSYCGEEPTGETLVTVTFSETEPGKTNMKLLHTGFKTEAARVSHQGGWEDYFNGWSKKFAK